MSPTVKIKLLITSALLALGVYAYITITRLENKNALLQNNQELLLKSNSEAHSAILSYKVQDSLNAAKVSALLLTIDDYERYRASDAALIKKLQLDKNDLQRAISAQLETIDTLKTTLRDTIIIKDSLKVEANAFEYHSLWTDLSGIILKDSITLSIINREHLQIVETVRYKRFLGFLWKTNRIKSRDLNIVSKNPNTDIVKVDYIYIAE